MQTVSFNLTNSQGIALPYGKITVYQTGTMTLASLFDGSGAATTNPVAADASALVVFQAANGTYDFHVSSADGLYIENISKQQIFDLQAVINALAAGTFAGMVSKIYSTQAGLFGDLAAAANSLGLVYNDSTPVKNDLYVKIGASGSGSWQGPLGLGVSNSMLAYWAGQAQGYAAAAAASATTAGAYVHLLPTGIAGTINGVAPLAVFGLRDAVGKFRSYIALMPDGSIVSAAIGSLVDAKLGGLQLYSATVPGWMGYAIVQRGADGKRYVLNGLKTDGTLVLYGAQPTWTYVPGTPIATGDVAAYLSTTALGRWLLTASDGQSLSMGEGNASAAVSLTASQTDLTFVGGLRVSKYGNTFGAVNNSNVAGQGTNGTKSLVEQNDALSADGITTGGETTLSGSCAGYNRYAAKNGVDPSTNIKFCFCTGHGSYSVNDLSGTWEQQVSDLTGEAIRLAGLAGKTCVMAAMSYLQGEGDAGLGTARSTWLTRIRALQSSVSSRVLTLTGQTPPVNFLMYQTASTVTNTLSSLNNIQLAQFDACANADGLNRFIKFVAPIYMLPHGSDGTHLSGLGYKWYGEYDGRARSQLDGSYDGTPRNPDCVWPISAIVNGTTLRIKYRVPQRPLVLDASETLIGLTQDYGFVVRDDTGTLTLSNIHVENGDEIVMTLSRTLGANPFLRYALDNLAPGLVLTNGASGNLHDSTAHTFTFGGVVYPLAHWAPHHQLPIFTVEF